MKNSENSSAAHSHVFLGADHVRSERRTWAVIALCTAMMIAEILGGYAFGSIALVADGWHMSTHAGALLLAASAYTLARRRANDRRFTFGTGKFGDLAGFSSALILGMIALLIGFEAVSRLFSPSPIAFAQAIPIAALGLLVNVVSAWLLGGGEHGHSHDRANGHAHVHAPDVHRLATAQGAFDLEIFETGAPPRFRLRAVDSALPSAAGVTIDTLRPAGAGQRFAMRDAGGFLESIDAIPEPHEFKLDIRIGRQTTGLSITEHDHSAHSKSATMHRDNNMRAAFVHVMADAAVSVMVILGLLAAKAFGWLWVDPLAGLVGALVIASWALGLIRDACAVLLDMCPDRALEDDIREMVQRQGDQIADLHVWRLGPGHLGAIVSIVSGEARTSDDYRNLFSSLRPISHLTIEVRRSHVGQDGDRAAA